MLRKAQEAGLAARSGGTGGSPQQIIIHQTTGTHHVATGKGWKAIQALGCLGSLLGVLLFFIGVATFDRAAKEPSSVVAALGILCLIVGLPVYLFGRAGAWWSHG